MSVAELRANIAHQLDNIHNPFILKEIEAMIDFKVSVPVYQCTPEQRAAIIEAQEQVARGDFFTDEEVQKAVELCLSGK
jgi:hypothetical protein